MVPGLDSTKEELQATAEYFLARGLATIAIDGPGQGESEYELPIEPAYEKVATAAVDYLRTREDVDGEKIGLFGVSLGGYYAARAAAYEPRLAAVVSLAGPYRFDLDWDELPAQTKATFQARSGAASEAEARAKAAELTLEDAAGRISIPLLVVGGGQRPDRARLPPGAAGEGGAGRRALLYPDGSHGVTNRAYESRSRMADWLAARLTAEGVARRCPRTRSPTSRRRWPATTRPTTRPCSAPCAGEGAGLGRAGGPRARPAGRRRAGAGATAGSPTRTRRGCAPTTGTATAIDEVEFHPAWHDLMATAVSHGLHAAPWRDEPARRARGPRGRASTSGARPRPGTCARCR